MAHQSMMEVDHSDWILSGPYSLDCSDGPLMSHSVLLWSNLFQIVLHHPKRFFFKQIGITHGPNLKLHGKV